MNFTNVIQEVTAEFDHSLQDLVRGVRKDDLTPESFGVLVEGLKGAANEAGLKALVGIVSKFEETAEVVEHGGQRHRFKQPSEKEWLTALGVARLTRRYYQPDAGGKGVVPLDVRCGVRLV
jgi:hypothetical protein